MFRCLAILILIAAVYVDAVSHRLVAPAHLDSIPHAEQLLILQNMFHDFKKEFGKVYYSQEEEENRIQTFGVRSLLTRLRGIFKADKVVFLASNICLNRII